jgi:hypothetical protein
MLNNNISNWATGSVLCKTKIQKRYDLIGDKFDDIGARTELGSDNICPVFLLNVGR